MIRISEMVFAGHPDKFCDQVADAIIAEAMKIDNNAYGQVEETRLDRTGRADRAGGARDDYICRERTGCSDPEDSEE